MVHRRKVTAPTVILFLLPILGCSQPPPPDTSEADIQAIRAIVDDFDAAFNAGDYDALAELYDENAIRMPNEAPPQVGRESIREWFRQEIEEAEREIDNTVRDAQVFGDWGYMWGDAEGSFTTVDGGETTVVDSKWMSVVRRQPDGSWKTYRDIYNTNVIPRTFVSEE